MSNSPVNVKQLLLTDLNGGDSPRKRPKNASKEFTLSPINLYHTNREYLRIVKDKSKDKYNDKMNIHLENLLVFNSDDEKSSKIKDNLVEENIRKVKKLNTLKIVSQVCEESQVAFSNMSTQQGSIVDSPIKLKYVIDQRPNTNKSRNSKNNKLNNNSIFEYLSRGNEKTELIVELFNPDFEDL